MAVQHIATSKTCDGLEMVIRARHWPMRLLLLIWRMPRARMCGACVLLVPCAFLMRDVIEHGEQSGLATSVKPILIGVAVKVLLWFELGEPNLVALTFTATALASGVLAFVALSISHRIGSRRASYWSVPIPIALLAVTILLVSLRTLMAFVADAAGLLCPPPWNCGDVDGVFGRYDDFAFFTTGLAVAAVCVSFARRRIVRRDFGSGSRSGASVT